jgi:hypothetical protein
MQSTDFDTVSEQYFAEYLDSAKYRWDRHPPIPGQSKIPDFGFDHRGVRVLSDVKERTPSKEQLEETQREIDAAIAGERHSTARHFNPVEQVRHLINQGRRKFKNFDGHLCALIIYNNGHRDVRLDPYIIFGAMLGNPGFTLSLNTETGRADHTTLKSGFLPRGGEMVRKYDPLTPSKSLRNISAVVALEPYRVPNPAFAQAREEEIRRLTDKFSRHLSDDERAGIIGTLFFDYGMKASLGDTWGLTVCTNPFANIPLPDDLFAGPYDTCWSIVDGVMTRVFAGEQRVAVDEPDKTSVPTTRPSEIAS